MTIVPPGKTAIKRLSGLSAELAREAGGVLKQGFNRRLSIVYKGRIDPVTQFDLKAEKLITSRIRKLYPDHAILAEEGTAVDSLSPYRWVIDPLDGTVNYAHGFPMYCVSIAVEYEEQAVAAAVFDPERNEMFTAAVGLGSFLDSRKIHVSSESRLDRSLLATGFSYKVSTERRNNLGLFARMVKKAQGVRRPGSAALDLCWLACGRIDGFWELNLHPWDTAAARLIVEQAGGRVTRLNARPFSIFDKDILASNGRIHRAMQKVLTAK
ncbi:MAG: inositol monophosphatase [candidate division Zixibacteria bacterium]|nr:inositol monophosphatase [candidate division Zixibacteria bacterium]MDH3938974.1 inositol monophosphatase [candidate division Zixibacteria bacterium]MDH4033791.1 inositol monophosphatase [candidate division Zixibacteria bacterium]